MSCARCPPAATSAPKSTTAPLSTPSSSTTATERSRLARDTDPWASERTPLYARVDAVDTDDGLLIMELELIEPTLWLRWHPPAADVLAAAIVAQLTPPA